MDEEISEISIPSDLIRERLVFFICSQLQMFQTFISTHYSYFIILFHFIPSSRKNNRQRKIYLGRYNAIFQAKDTNTFGHRDLCCLSDRHFSVDKFPLVNSPVISRTMFSRNSNLSHLSLYYYAVVDILSFLLSN